MPLNNERSLVSATFLTTVDIQQVIATSHRALALPSLTPLTLAVIHHCQQHQVRPEQAIMQLLRQSPSIESREAISPLFKDPNRGQYG
jgi:hypothetical protein